MEAQKFRVVHLWRSVAASGGGGGIAMYRLHKSLTDSGISSKILCDQDVTPDSDDIDVIPRDRVLDGIARRITRPIGLNDIHRVSSSMVKGHPFFESADIVHLHGLHSSFLSYLSLPSLTRHKTVVWTLHDDWAMTGHCASPMECERWKIGCGRCPDLDRNPKMTRDATRIEWRLKRWAYQRSKMTLVALSEHQRKNLESSILRHLDTVVIPNGVNIDSFHPRPKDAARVRFGLPSDKIVLIFAALSLDAPLKGGDLLVKAINSLDPSIKDQIHLLLIGNGGEAIAKSAEVPTTRVGVVGDDNALSAAYSASDVFVFPTRSEAFGLVLLESMACGTPVISYNVGGVSSIIDHKTTGLLVDPESIRGLATSISLLVENEGLRQKMSIQARDVAVTKFSEKNITGDYLRLYDRLLNPEPTMPIPSDEAAERIRGKARVSA